ncbi:hypothetical protein WISP_47367 [Willisornis vidua]|uniref:Prolactin receptor n=1 Tax=Willisornis vidua TaxID=1566151 RepID=A0ABQ9DK36_9PASS|nr:hypothetical protein WISP_47367 [Willisornis vidua]
MGWVAMTLQATVKPEWQPGPQMPNQEKQQWQEETSFLPRSSEEQENGFTPTDSTHSCNLHPELCDVPKNKRDVANPLLATSSPSLPPTQNDQKGIGIS